MKFDPFENETVLEAPAEGGGVDPGADPAAVVPAEPGAADPVAATADPAAPGPAPVDWDNVEVLREAAARIQALGYTLTPGQPAAETTEVEYDPYDPNSLVGVLEKSPLGQAVAQLMQAEQARQAEHVDTQVNTAIATVRAELGFTDTTVPDDHIYALGNQLAAAATRGLPDYVIAQRGEQIARDSIKQAVEFFQARDAARDASAVEAYKLSLTEGGSTLLDLPAGGAAVVPGQQEYKDELDFARNYRFTRT